MGIKGLLKELPGGRMQEQRVGFDTLAASLGVARVDARIDAGSVLFICALRHKEPFDNGDYGPAAREFVRQLLSFEISHSWDFTMVFDGCSPPEKRHELKRRRAKGGGIVIDGVFIAMCVNICRVRSVKYVVSPAEADMQVGRLCGGIPVCNDSDELAYGNRLVVIVDNWGREEYRLVDLDASVTEETKSSLPLFYYFRRYGMHIIHWWAAIMGCDISEKASGIVYAGPDAFFAALCGFDNKPSHTLTPKSFATAFHEHVEKRCRDSYSIQFITNEMRRVARWYTTGGTYYDEHANVRSVSGAIVQAASPTSRRHMIGDLNPKTMEEYTPDERSQIDAVQPHNLIHNSAARRETINGMSLPPDKTTVAECRPEELKTMIVARGGNVTSKEGRALTVPELQRQVRAYLSMEKENSQHVV